VRDDLRNLAAGEHVGVAQTLPRLAADLRSAQSALGLLSAVGPRLVGDVPLLGRSVVAERAVGTAFVSLLSASRTLAADTEHLGTAGRIDLTRLDRLHTDLAGSELAVAGALDRLDRVQTSFTPWFVGSAVSSARGRVAGADAGLRRATAMTAALGDLLGAGGPRTLLLGLENNAEIRGTGGLVSTVALAHSSSGRLTVGAFRDVTSSLSRSPSYATSVPAPADYLRSYGGFGANTTIWTNANFSPSVPDSATVLAGLTQRSLGVRPDAVVLLDVPAMAAIVGSTGSTVLLPDGHRVTGPELAYDLLVQSYGPVPVDPAQQQARRVGLERAAGGVVRTLLGRPPTLSLILTLAAQVAGRHIVLWSADPAAEAELVDAGAAGAVDPAGGDIAMATVDNLGDSPMHGNKLDYYARRTLDVQVVLGKGQAEVFETFHLHNDAPAALGSYVAGPLHPGRLSELVGLAFGGSARVTGFSVDGVPGRGEVEPLDGGQQLLTEVVLPRGASVTLSLSYTVAITGGSYRLLLVPQPTVYPAQLVVRFSAQSGVRLHAPLPSIDRPWTSVSTLTVAVG